MRKSIASIALAAALAWALPSQAAVITAEQDGLCSPKKDDVTEPCWTVSVDGDILKSDFDKFEAVIKKNHVKLAIVKLNSDGGLLIEGLLIGKMIHDMQFSTYVPQDAYCVSVCAAMWVSGAERFVTSESKIGFHQAYGKDRHGGIHADPRANEMIKAYYVKIIGLPKPAADFFVSADPKDVNWMNADLARGFELQVTELPTSDKKVATATKEETPTATLPKSLIDDLTKPATKTVERSDPQPAPKAVERPKPHHQRVAGGGGRTCSFSIPLPYIGGIRIRGRC